MRMYPLIINVEAVSICLSMTSRCSIIFFDIYVNRKQGYPKEHASFKE